ncbi:hypothetical protein [Nocardia otitidiscaviarum]|uniref:hypothetical protein n=1 Tax=Nocardia otitidiscaviarum TaxID=1823 RepID=UPI00245774B4|nr:hypothetical protein [Nocardia otitidiscaviarum]
MRHLRTTFGWNLDDLLSIAIAIVLIAQRLGAVQGGDVTISSLTVVLPVALAVAVLTIAAWTAVRQIRIRRRCGDQ